MAPQHGTSICSKLADEQLVVRFCTGAGSSQHIYIAQIVWYHIKPICNIAAVIAAIQHSLPNAVTICINLVHCCTVVDVICQHIGIASAVSVYHSCECIVSANPGRYLLLPVYDTAGAVQLYEISAYTQIHTADQHIATIPGCGNCIEVTACVQRCCPHQRIGAAVYLGY